MHGLPVAAAVSEVLPLLQQRLHKGAANAGMAVTGTPRNPMPRRATYVVPKLAKPMSEDDLGMVLATIARAAVNSTTARRDFVMV